MSKTTKKILAICLCAALCLGGAGMAFAQASSKKADDQPVSAAQQAAELQQKISKDETVYVLTGADGSVKKIIVSDWLKNELGSASVADKSDLSDIENVKGDESYTINGDNMTVWDAQGNDIYYQGNIQKELPVGLSVRYYLDGKSVSPEELKGKSGKVTIRFDYENRQYETVQINGVNQRIYVPFAMLTGMILDNDTFQNVQITNGKLVNDGDRTVVVGLAFPGLQENLNLSRDDLSIPDSVEITADVTNFSLGMTVTLACNDLFSQLGNVDLTSLDSTSALDQLTGAMDQLLSGSSSLYEGLSTLLDKSSELVSGVEELAQGAAAIKSGADSVDDGAAQLKAGLADLSSGLNTLSANSEALNSGAKQVFNSLLETAATQIRAKGLNVPDLTIENYAEELNTLIKSLDETTVYETALKQVTDAVEAQRPVITQKVTEAVRQQVETKVAAAVRQQVTEEVTAAVQQQVTATVTDTVQQQVAEQVIQAAANMSKADYDAAVAAGIIPQQTQDAVNAAIQAQMDSEAVQSKIAENVSAQMVSEAVQSKITENIDTQISSEAVQATITENTDAQMQTEAIQATIQQQTELQVQKAISENMASDAVQSQLKKASEGAQTLIALKASLDDYNTFYLGLLTYTGGVDDAAAGANALYAGADQLKDGTAQLRAGAAQLYNGVLQLQDGTPALVSGVTQLKDGAMQLSEGLQQFNRDGIQKLVNLLQNDVGDLSARVQATIDVSKDYRSFAGISDDAEGQVKFIYRTDEIA
jgi:putative membrane protein